MKNNTFNFTKTGIKALPIPDRGNITYFDEEEKGLCLYITPKGHISFFVRKKILGKSERFIIGTFPDISVQQARKAAIDIKNRIANDKENPNDKKRQFSQESTLKELFDTYMEKHSKPNKKSWVYDEREIPRFCSHWFNRKISTITQFEIKEWLENIKEENGVYQANHMLERLRSMYSKKIEWGWKGLNPCTGIGKFPVKSRDRFIQPEEMKRFFAALNNEQSIAREYFFMALYTGARKTNTLAMRWEQIDFDLRTWYIPETKNGESQTVPLIEDAVILLQEIKKKQQDVDGEVVEWVFPSEESKYGHLQDPKKAWKRILTEAGLKDLRIHDIRRTLGSYQAIAGTSLHIIGKSLGHKSSAATQVYARMNLEPVRNSMQKAVNVMKGKEAEETSEAKLLKVLLDKIDNLERQLEKKKK